MVGVEKTVTETLVLLVLPQPLLTTQLKLSVDVATVEYEGPVAPAMGAPLRRH